MIIFLIFSTNLLSFWLICHILNVLTMKKIFYLHSIWNESFFLTFFFILLKVSSFVLSFFILVISFSYLTLNILLIIFALEHLSFFFFPGVASSSVSDGTVLSGEWTVLLCVCR